MTRPTGFLALVLLLCVNGCQDDSEPAPDTLPDASVPQDAGNWVAAPTLEISFNGITVPDLALHCSERLCNVPDDQAIDFGKVGVSREAEVLLRLRNPSVCDVPAGVDPCAACALTVDRHPDQRNLGIGFKAESNTAGHFRLAEPFTGPVVVRDGLFPLKHGSIEAPRPVSNPANCHHSSRVGRRTAYGQHSGNRIEA